MVKYYEMGDWLAWDSYESLLLKEGGTGILKGPPLGESPAEYLAYANGKFARKCFSYDDALKEIERKLKAAQEGRW